MKGVGRIRNTVWALGLATLLVAGYQSLESWQFLHHSSPVQGQVVGLTQVDQADSSGALYPVIEYRDGSGHTHQFIASTSASRRDVIVGVILNVRYLPDSPGTARIDSFMAIWGSALASVVIGFGLMIWASVLGKGRGRARLEEDLRQFGDPVEAEVADVEQNGHVIFRGQRPFRLVARWRHPETRQEYLFRSKDLWYNPKEYLEGRRVRVIIDRRDPSRYWVDLPAVPIRHESDQSPA